MLLDMAGEEEINTKMEELDRKLKEAEKERSSASTDLNAIHQQPPFHECRTTAENPPWALSNSPALRGVK